MRKHLLLLLAISLFFSGCSVQEQLKSNDSEVESINSTTRQGDSTLSGTIMQSGETYSLLDATGKQTEIDSYKIDLSEYVGKKVSVTGQYSGDTLFAAKVEGAE